MDRSRGKLDPGELKEFLDEKASLYNSPAFIDTDPIQVPHLFSIPEDIEIAGFLTATIAWGQKTTIISNAKKLVTSMQGGPYSFLLNARESDFERYLSFVHRTFNGIDCIYFMKALQRVYQHHGGLKGVFYSGFSETEEMKDTLIRFRDLFFQGTDPGRTSKHVADVGRNASGKRLNMFLRWMVRRDRRGVDFGIWDTIPMSALYIPLDVHTGTVSRKLGMLSRKQDDWRSVAELTEILRRLDPVDPIRYDFALFGLGAMEKF